MRTLAFLLAALVVTGCADSRTPPVSVQLQASKRQAVSARELAAQLQSSNAGFRAWVSQYQSTGPTVRTAMVERGLALVNARRTLMRQALLETPEAAIGIALTPPERDALPGVLRERVERWHDGIGTLSIIGATLPSPATTAAPLERFVSFDDAESTYLKAGVFGRRLEQHSQRGLRLHGVELDGVIGVTESPLRRRFQGERFADVPNEAPTVCPTSKLAVEPALVFHAGDSAVGFCTTLHASQEEHRLTEREAGDGTAATEWTMGAKTVLFIRVDFSDRAGDPISEAAATGLISTTTSAFFAAASYGKTSMSATVTPTLRMPKTASTYAAWPDDYLGLRSDALAAAKAQGFDSTSYTHFIIASTGIFSGWSGRGSVGTAGVWINGEFSLRVAGHELGHNYGVYHANFWSAGPSIIGAGSNVEYGNSFDMMGLSGDPSKHFNVWFKRLLGWVPSSEVQVVSTSGTYRIWALETAITSGMHGLKIPRGGDLGRRDYWLEFRQAFGGNASAMNGALINFGFPYSGAAGSQLLDLTPDGNQDDSALVIGRTFSDSLAGIHITPVGKGGTTPESLDVTVNLGNFASNHAPTATIMASSTNAASDTAVTFTVSASDSDNDVLAYAWRFDDGSFGPNTASVTKTLSGNRVFNVRCTVSDMKGGVVTVGVPVTVGTPAAFTLSGTVTLDGLGLEGVRIVDGSRETFSKSDGQWQLTDVPAGTYTVSASKFNYTFTSAFSTPLPVTASMTGLDFLAGAAAGYAISGSVSSFGGPISGVAVTDGSRTSTTDAQGNYRLSPVPNGRFLLQASKPGWLFILPYGVSNPVEVLGGDVTVSFSATGTALSGTIPGAGVTAAPLVSDGTRTVTAVLSRGDWSFEMKQVPNGTWNLTATSPGVVLKPANFTNPLVITGAEKTNFNFAVDAASTFTVSGRVTTGGTPLPGVVISDGTRSATTDDLGVYLLTGVPAGTVTLTPALAGQTFIPATKSVTVSTADVPGQDFTTSVLNMAPTFVTYPQPMTTPITGKTAALTVLAADDSPESQLTYTWAFQGTGTVSFSANGTNAAKNTTVTLPQAGTLSFEVVVRDPGGLSARASFQVAVTQTPTATQVLPSMANVLTGTTALFSALLQDQFGNGMYLGPPEWSINAVAGTVTSNGLFTAGVPGGPYVLSASAGSKTGTSSVTVTEVGSPTLASPAKATPSNVIGTTAGLSVLGADDQGEGLLKYTWSAAGAPSGSGARYSVNGSNAAKSSTVTFDAPGAYDFVVTIADADGHAITSGVHVEVVSTLSRLALEPQVSMVMIGSTQQFIATATDQFNKPFLPKPMVTFTTSGGGAIDSMGLFTAQMTAGGPFTVTARARSVMGTAMLMVSETPDTEAPVVALTAPLANARLVGMAQLAAATTDNVGVTKVEFFIDAMKLGETAVSPYVLTVDLAAVSNGAHVLTAKASDAAGNAATSDGVPVKTGAEPVDSAPPVVALTRPLSGDVPLSVLVVVDASDDVGVVSVALEVDETVVRQLTSMPWTATLELSAGAHGLVAIASDASGKTARSAKVNVVAKAPGADGGAGSEVPDAPVKGSCGCNGVSAAPMMMGLLALLRRRSSSRKAR